MGIVAVAGFFHETNTFSLYPTDYTLFEQGGSLPGLTRGQDMIKDFAGLNIPAAGAIAELQRRGHTVLPVAYASAVPNGTVTDDAFERICALIVDGLDGMAHLDAIYLDLHGAMVAEKFEDAEGELVRRIRQRIKQPTIIVASLDLHANMTQALVDGLDAATAFRTYPHVDMADSGRRAAVLIDRMLDGERFSKAFRVIPFLVPLHAQSTEAQPGEHIYRTVKELAQQPGIASADFTFGFPPADIHACGPALVVYGTSDAAAAAADRLEKLIRDAEYDFAVPLFSPREAVKEAERRYNGRPIVIADTQDNPGAGGTGDTPGMLRALLEEDAQEAVLALLHDPMAARRAHELGEGKTAAFKLGGHSGAVQDPPVDAEFLIERLSDGHFVAVGPMFRGNAWNVGATAVLRRGGVRVVVAERRMQAHDTALLRGVGIDPAQQRIIVVKSTVHFRADFGPLAGDILIGVAPGIHLADNNAYAYRKLRPDVRRMPAARPG